MAWLRQLLAVVGALVALAPFAPTAGAHGGHHHAVSAMSAMPAAAAEATARPAPVGGIVELRAASVLVAMECPTAHRAGMGDGCCHGGACSVSGCGTMALALPDPFIMPCGGGSAAAPCDGPPGAGRGLRPPDHPPKRRI